ncbi:hypothetical protein TRFO_15960 [Tritrichomonas foetus]|uniref:non-specific serine/threonine protein kinase n=1 Tax=Tritrichomonas foetus TaxID=1144522 RepID=A0A1J4KRE7_9EUKA|nr:hypothetical protein TRFO_15960 [Tritrichomonas foetus]|eukprot:OHT13827.1 hypothetical protein TRFO_15960 [Tritrichomonas foetus]
MFENVLHLIHPNPNHNYDIWKYEYHSIKNSLSPRLRILSNEQLSSIFSDWHKQISCIQAVETVEKFSNRVLLSSLLHFFTQNPLLTIYSDYEEFYDTKSLFVLRVITKAIKLFAENSQSFDLSFSSIKIHLIEMCKRGFKREQWPNVVYILKSMKKYIPDQAIGFLHNYSQSFYEIADQIGGKLQDIYIKTLFFYADYDRSSLLYLTSNNVHFLDNITEIKHPAQIYTIASLLSKHLQYEEYKVDKLFKIILDYFLSGKFLDYKNINKPKNSLLKFSNNDHDNFLRQTKNTYNNTHDHNIELNFISNKDFNSLHSNSVLSLSTKKLSNHNSFYRNKNGFLSIDNMNESVMLEKKRKSSFRILHAHSYDNPKKLILLNPENYSNDYSCSNNKSNDDYEYQNSLHNNIDRHDSTLVHQIQEFKQKNMKNKKGYCVCDYTKITQNEIAEYDFIKSIEIFIKLLNYISFSNFDKNQLLSFLLEYPTNSLCAYIEKNYDVLDLSLIEKSKIFYQKRKCNKYFCRFKLFKTLIKIHSNINFNFEFKIDVNNFSKEDICKHFIQVMKTKPSLLSKELKEKIIALKNDDNFLKVILCLHKYFPEFDGDIRELTKNNPVLYLKSLKCTTDPDSRNNILLKFILEESQTKFRLKAIKMLTPTENLANSNFFYTFLYDHCFKVRKEIFLILPKFYIINPLFEQPIIRKYIIHIISLIRTNNYCDLRIVSKMAKLADCFGTFCNTLANITPETNSLSSELIESLLLILNERYPFERNEDLFFDAASCVSSFGSCLHSSSLHSSSISPKSNASFRNQIFLSVDEPLLLKRDKSLLKAISNMGELCRPYLKSILNIFYVIFTTEKHEKFLLSTIKSLNNLCLRIKGGLNFNTEYPEIQKPILHLLKVVKCMNLKISLLQLLGSSFDSLNENKGDNTADSTFQNCVVSVIIKTLLSHDFDGHWWKMKVIAVIFEQNSERAAGYAIEFIKKIFKFLSVMRNNRPEILYQCLTIVLLKCPMAIISLMDDLISIIELRINEISCLKMCVTLIPTLPEEYSIFIQKIYNLVIERMMLYNFHYLKWSIRLLSLAIVHFKMPIDIYLCKLSRSSLLNEHEVVRSLEYLVQNTDVTNYLAHIYQITRPIKINTVNLFKSLSEFQHFEMFDLQNNFSDKNQKIKFIDLNRNMKSLSHEYSPPEIYFLNMKIFTTIENLNDFVGYLIVFSFRNSPDVIFRTFSEFVYSAWNLAAHLFPAAFLTIWKICSNEDRACFSKMLGQRIEKIKQIKNQELLNLIEFMDMKGYTFDIDYLKISLSTSSPYYSLLIIQRHFILNKNLPRSLTYKIYEISKKLNKKANLQALFNKFEHCIDPNLTASCHCFLGNWEQALSIYENENAPLTKKLLCLFSLRRYDEIVEYYDQFCLLPDDKDKIHSLAVYMWVFAVRRENYKISEILKKYKFIEKGNLLYPQIVYYITTKNYNKANELVDIAFKKLNNYDFEKGDTFSNQKKLCKLQLLSEFNEIINIYNCEVPTEVCDIWNRRVKDFERVDWMWERLILPRSILKPINSYHESYIPIISELRKGGHYEIIHHYFDKTLNLSCKSILYDERLKLEWDEGSNYEAYCLVATTLGFGLVENIYEFIYLTAYHKIHMPGVLLTSFSQSPVFGSDLRDYIAYYFETTSFENAMSILMEKSPKKQQYFFTHLTTKFPEQMFNLFSMNVNQHFDFSRVCQLTGKYSTLFYHEVSFRYYNAARQMNPCNISIMKGWAMVNLSLFIESHSEQISNENLAKLDSEELIPIDADRINESMGSLDLSDESSKQDYLYDEEEYDQQNYQENSGDNENSYGSEKSFNNSNSDEEILIHESLQSLDTSLLRRVSSQASFSDPIQNSLLYDQIKPNITIHDENKKDHDNFSFEQDDSIDVAQKIINGEAYKVGKTFVAKNCDRCDEITISEKDKAVVESRRKILKECTPDMNNHRQFALNIIDSCLCIVEYDENFYFEFLVQLFFALFSLKLPDDLPKDLENRILALSPKLILNMLPQISIHIDCDVAFIEKLFLIACKEDFQSVYFSLNFHVKNNCQNASLILERLENLFSNDKITCLNLSANQINNNKLNYTNISQIKSQNKFDIHRNSISANHFVPLNNSTNVVKECRIFDEGLAELSVNAFEKWKNSIEAASKSFFNCDNILAVQYNDFHHPKTEFDHIFIQKFGKKVIECENLFKKHTQDNMIEMWNKLYDLYSDIDDAWLDLTELSLSHCSPNLSNYEFHRMLIPGSTNTLYIIDEKVKICQTAQRPRCVNFIVKETGRKCEFLLKSKEDLRNDQRIMQFFNLLNTFFRKSFKRDNLEITRYKIIPLRKDCGLIRFVKNSESFQQIVEQFRSGNQTTKNRNTYKYQVGSINHEGLIRNQHFNQQNNEQNVELTSNQKANKPNDHLNNDENKHDVKHSSNQNHVKESNVEYYHENYCEEQKMNENNFSDEGNMKLMSGIIDDIPNKKWKYCIQKAPMDIERSLDSEFASETFETMNNLQKYEFFNYVDENTRAIELFDAFFHRSRSSFEIVTKMKTFTKSLAVMSMVGYVIGLGDRHPSNILINVSSGAAIHIDFGDCFESAQKRKKFPEKVPFRLTRMFANALEGNRSQGYFEQICVKVMKLMRKKKSSLSAQLTVFLKESQKEKSSIDKVIRKLSGNELNTEKSAELNNNNANETVLKQVKVEDQVRKLIEIAEDPINYCRHFRGWCPFW